MTLIIAGNWNSIYKFIVFSDSQTFKDSLKDMNINIVKKTPSKTRRYNKNRRYKGKPQMSPHKIKGELLSILVCEI